MLSLHSPPPILSLSECVIVLWTANTERFTDVADGLNTSAEALLKSIDENAEEISPSNIFAVAAILEGAHYVNGSPQNTLVPGKRRKVKNLFTIF